MRSNLPVSQREFSFSPDETLVSVTDLKGRITYCNPAFIHVSGFAKDELLGQPHNLVRHPDMPEEAFRDMWDTIQNGLPWTGLVKNRRKNGDHYWVQANATPMMDGGKITGFLSVRTVPTRDAVKNAEKLYAAMREAAASGNKRYALHAGKVVRADTVGKLLHWLSPSRRTVSVLVQFLMVAIAVVPFALMASFGVSVTVAIVVALLGTWVSSQLSISHLQGLVADANHLASGDLSHPITAGAPGEVGQLQQALNQLSVNLRTVVHDVRQDVHNLGVAVQEIASGANRCLYGGD
jgi:aerotaxis receptor